MTNRHLSQFNINPCVAVIDLETLDYGENAVIASIGCVIKNLENGNLEDTFYVICNTEEQKAYRTVNPEVVEFHNDRSKVSQEVYDDTFINGPQLLLKQAMVLLHQFIRERLGDRPAVFGNGPEFDNTKIDTASKQCGVESSWDHGCNQSARTMVLLGRRLLGMDPKYTRPKPDKIHHALYDAIEESEYIYEIYNALQTAINDRTQTPVLMSVDNPTGWKLEDLLLQLRDEIVTKSGRIENDGSEFAQTVLANNNALLGKLLEAEDIQRGSMALLDKKAPDTGPSGKPRIGT